MASLQETVARMFEAISSGIPFQQQWEGDLRRLGNVDASNIEGRTLLQQAVIQGRRDWVKALVASGADLCGDSGQAALALAREMSSQHPEDAQRMAIMDGLEMIFLRERRERHDGGVRLDERSPSVPPILNLQWLEDFLGVKLETCGKRVKLSADVLQRLKETVDQDGNSLLLRTAREGNFECVDLLLRCGAQVNASRTIDSEELRAIDFADERGHKSIVKLLLQWDSVMPLSHEEDPEDWLTSLAEEDEDIEKLLQRRDDFHKKVMEGDVNGIRAMVSSGEGKDDSCGHQRYWVNREGRSALLTAAYYDEPRVLALLKRLKFECLEDEKCKVESILEEDINKQLEYNSALVHDIEPIKYRHVLMMALQSFMHKGELEQEGDGFIRQVYEAADKVSEARVLMQCLQYDPNLQVIFDKEKTDILCMYQPSSSGVRGAYVSSIHRVYASAALDSWSDTVSNLVHELAHTVLHVVFENDGLPYSKGNQEREETYNKIVSNILSQENITNCHEIMQRVKECYTENYYPHEVIVRVPEILTKLKVEGDDGESSEPWKNDHEKELFNFYRQCVENDILSWIESQSKTNPFDFLSQHVRDCIGIGNIETPRPINHNGIHYLQVSNLALGVSHVKKSLEGTVCVDWAKFLEKKKTLEINLMRRNISRMAVVWDERMGNQFCEESETCSEDCPGYKFSSIKEYVTFIVPKSFIIPGGNYPLEYKWEHLSSETKEWTLGRKVRFQGKDFTLNEMIDFVAEGSGVESIMSSITDSDVIAWLVDEHMVNFGSEIKSLWGIRGDKFIRNQPQIRIDRTLEMRKIDLNEVILRKRDAVFFINAKDYDLWEMNVGEVSYWNSVNVPDGTNSFLLDEHRETQVEKELCNSICEQIRHSGKEWPYAHFFQFSQGKHTHVLTHCMSGNRCRLLADEPGCGKTVFAYDAVVKEKETNPKIWTEVVELSKCEKVLDRWKENNSEGNGSVENSLYNLITVDLRECQLRNMTIVSKLFKHLCQEKEKVSIYFDGFDEICPSYGKTFSRFLKKLLEETQVKVFVTTRTNESQPLEEILCTFGHHLVPFHREEQIYYFNKVWNSLLKSLEDSKRANKLTSVISNLRAHSDSDIKFGKVIKCLELHSEEPSEEVDFTEVAEKVIRMCQSSVEDEGFLSGIPLHAWMIATVFFEDNFRVTQSLELSHLYTRFVTAKVNEYCSAKAKLTERQLEDVVWRSTFNNLIQNLKNFSASFFLRDQKYKPEEKFLFDLVRAGLLLKKSDTLDFIHRTVGELFFSVWILEEAKDPNVTRILLESVLLDNNFQKVREFINELLLTSDENMSANGGEGICKISDPSKLAFDKDAEFPNLFCKCFHRAVSSCHRGIIKYLAKSWKKILANALFSMGVCNCGGSAKIYPNKRHNAFCLKHRFDFEPRYVETIHTLLTLTEENCLIENLRDFISNWGLQWAGINEEELWRNEESREFLLRIIQFFIKHCQILRTAIGDKILRKDYLKFMKHLSLFSFNEWKCFLNSILGENWLRKLLLPSFWNYSLRKYSPISDIWFCMVMYESVEKVSEMWDLIMSNLKTNKERKAFLLRKDEHGMNCLSLSILYNNNFLVLMFVWKQVESQFRREELNEFIFESFESNIFLSNFVGYQKVKNITDWLNHITAENVISLYYSVLLLNKLPVHKFTIGGWFPVQDFLMAAGGDERAREEVMEFLAERQIWGLDFPNYSFGANDDYHRFPEFRSIVQREWERILPLLSPHLPTHPIPLYKYELMDGRIVEKIRERGGGYGVDLATMVTYLLFSWRQFELISKYLTSSDLTQSALKNYFSGILDITKFFGSESIPVLLSVPTAFFSKEQIHEAFLKSDFLQRIADLKILYSYNVSKFLDAYDVTRLYLGEDALWVTHSITRRGRNESLLDVLLSEQEEGIFESFFSIREDFLKENPLSRFVDLQSLEFCDEWPFTK